MAMFPEELFEVFGEEDEAKEERKKKRTRPDLSAAKSDKETIERKKVRLDLEVELEEDEEEKAMQLSDPAGEGGDQEKMDEGKEE